VESCADSGWLPSRGEQAEASAKLAQIDNPTKNCLLMAFSSLYEGAMIVQYSKNIHRYLHQCRRIRENYQILYIYTVFGLML
jgi:hypothetical protein